MTHRKELDAQVLDWIAETPSPPHTAAPDDVRFDALARELFDYQYEHGGPYRRMCDAFGVTPASVADWREIPSVPTGAFKQARLAAFPRAEEIRTFRTSGTSSEGRGELHLDTLAVYEASLLATFGSYVAAGQRLRYAVLAPSVAEARDSSLSYMFDHALRELGAADSRHYVTGGELLVDALVDDLADASVPIALVGTAFAFVHLIDALRTRGRSLGLPEGSRAMETGGFKGRSREVGREELHAEIGSALGLAAARVVNQYGMCELGSQFYEDSLLTGRPTKTKRIPPWVRVRVVDPGTLEDVAEGEEGVLVHYDLANTGSVLAVQTADRGIQVAGGFEVLGRVAGAEARGCSLAADALLAGLA